MLIVVLNLRLESNLLLMTNKNLGYYYFSFDGLNDSKPVDSLIYESLE